MTLSAGTKLGPYEIVGAVGAGGMGEVYRARDTRLGREVAVKVLPPTFANDPDRLRRFEVEARTVAALNHPNILALFDIGEHLTGFPKAQGKWKVSTGGSSYPVWSPGGKELFYKDLSDQMLAVPVALSGNELKVGAPQLLFHATVSGVGVTFDAAKDGKRLLVNLAEEEGVTPLNLVVNWPAELKK